MPFRNRLSLAALAGSALLGAVAVIAAPPALQAPSMPGTPAGAQAPALDPSKTTRLTPHVWVIRSFPNIAIIVGDKAVLVVDTGLGTGPGRLVAEEARQLGGSKPIYVTTTHFHPEHAAGFGGFPRGTILLRPRVQEQELALDKGRMLARFREHNGEALADADYGHPQLFETERRLDLGGVHARIFWAGPAHTYGDTLVWVPEDSALVSGDVVQNHVTPTFLGGGIGPAEWLATLTPIAALKPALVIPDHSPPGPGVAMIAAEQDFLRTLIDLTDAARAKRLSEDAAVTDVVAQLRQRFPGWTMNPLTADGIRRAWRHRPEGAPS